jgi:dihydroorotase
MNLPTSRAHLSRRSFLKHTLVTSLAVGPAGRLFAEPARNNYDLLIAGGTVIDPLKKTKSVADVAIKAGKIVRVAEKLDPGQAARVLDAKGLTVSPGWIDLHAHVFLRDLRTGGTESKPAGTGGPGWQRSLAVHPDRDAGVHTGVTTLADPGGFEASTFALFRREIVEKSLTRVLGFVNVSATRGSPIHGDWSRFNQELTIKTIVDNRDVIEGVKVLSSQRHSGNLGVVPTKLAVQAARESGTRVMAHIGLAPPLIQDVLDLLGPGDIITHCWKGFPAGLFHRNGKPVEEVRQALKRGVRMDLGHGQQSFSWEAARHARAAGLPLHSLSTDLHQGSIKGPVWSYGRTMAKMLHLGFSLEEVVEMTTLGPAKLIGREKELGSVLPGTAADLTLFRVVEAPTVLTDSEGKSEMGKWDVEPVHCVRAGKVISEMKLPPRGDPVSVPGGGRPRDKAERGKEN